MDKQWNKAKLGDYIEINPKEILKKGTIAKKISMDKLQPFCKDVPDYEMTEFTGGAKFRNGDTIMARITPCLENGKTAMVNVLDKDEIGFGSTEYIVFRSKTGLTDEQFVYYLVCSPMVREPAIKSMVGSSGRQRVQTDVVSNLEISFPHLDVQRNIGNILKTIDDRITLNNQINENLEQQLRSVFMELFSDKIANVEANNHRPLGELVINIDNRGKTPPLETTPTEYPIIDVRALSGTSRIVNYANCTKFVSAETYSSWFRSGHPKPKDILISTVGSLAEIKIFLGSKGCIAQNVVGFRTKDISPYYLYQYLTAIKNDLVAYNIGSVQPSIKVTHIIKHPIYIPSTEELETFDALAESATDAIYNNTLESERLAGIRDALIPKLMSGEIDLSKVQL